MKRRVVITGVGPITPIGIGKDEFWGNLIAGKSGIGLITQFDASDPGFTTKIAGEVKDFDFANYGDKKEGKRMDRVTQFAVAAAKLAVEDAELDLEKIDPVRAGVCVGSGIGGIHTFLGRPVGEEVTQSMTKDIAIKKDSWSSARFQFKVDKPKLWDIDTPNCYVAVSRVFMDGKEMDSYETPFGIRTIEFTHDQGFMLNGQKVAIKGVCMHHDLGALGAAFNEVAAERQLRIMKEMGANAIRTSHNPPAPELVALCDRMGLMMQLELADTWQKGKRKNDYNLLFDDWSEADMRSLVRHYRNHPSVIMWSIGNEMPDQTTDQGVIIARNLTAYCHDEDPTRPTSLGCNKRDAVFRDIVNQVDIFGLNYFHKTYPVFKEQNSTRRYHASETSSATSSRGEYFFPVTTDVNDSRSGFQLSSYDMTTIGWGCAPEVQFKMNEEYPFMSGEFVWTGFDYLGEPTPYNKDLTNLLNFSDPNELEKARKELEELGKIKTPSRSSYFGIVDLCGFPKDRYYNYKSYWRPDVPTVHILPHWNWQERIGEITPVHIYTSGDAVELFLNAKALSLR